MSLWGGAAYIGQFAFQAVAPFTGDMFGRRVNLWLLTVSMTIVSRNECIDPTAGDKSCLSRSVPSARELQVLYIL